MKKPKTSATKKTGKRGGKKKPSVQKMTAGVTEELRELYVQGVEDVQGKLVYPSFEGMAADFNVSLMTLRRRAKAGDWLVAREHWADEVRRLKDDKKRKELVDQAVEFDSGALSIAKALHSQVGDILNIAQRETRRLRGNADKEVGALDPHNTYRYLSNSALCQLANVTAQAQTIGRLAVGQSTGNLNVSGSEEIRETVTGMFDTLREIAKLTGKVSSTRPVIDHIP